MSRQNKVNPDHYQIRGRLTPDESARERVKQRESTSRAVGRAGGGAAPNARQKPVSGKGRAGRD